MEEINMVLSMTGELSRLRFINQHCLLLRENGNTPKFYLSCHNLGYLADSLTLGKDC